MTNQYVPDLGQLGSGDIARSSDVNDRYENTVAGFDRLPTPKNGEQGFSAPVPVGEPTNSDHAATKNFVETGVTSQVNIAEGHKDAAAASEAAALVSEQNADASEAVALAQTSIATTKANEASTSASEALASKNLASASEAAALASENAAFASETAAASSESAADLDRIAAQAARVGAEAALDSFDDRYLGAKAADPTLDNDGNGLLTGALYFDTNTSKMKVYDGSLWEPAYVPPSLLTFQAVTDTGGTTTNSISVSGLTASNADVNFTGLATSSSTTDPVVVIDSSGRIEKKTLGTNAYNSDTYDNYQGWQLNGGSSTQAISKNETVTFTGSGGTTVTNSGNTVTIDSVDTNTTNFNLQVNSGSATNISAGETINYTGSGGVSVSRTGNSITIDGSAAGITDILSDTTPQLGGTLDANGNTIDMGANTITDTKVGQWDAAYGDKVNTVGFDTGSGILTLSRQDGGAVTKDLDGRYPLNDGTGASGTWAINISGNAATATTASAVPFNNLSSKASGTGAYITTGSYSAPAVLADKITGRSGSQLVLNAGESDNYDSGQTAESVYVNAESGLTVTSSPDNWVSGWAGRNTAVINNASGDSTFPGNISTTTGVIETGGGSENTTLYPGGAIYVRQATSSASGLWRGYAGATVTSSISSSGAALFTTSVNTPRIDADVYGSYRLDGVTELPNDFEKGVSWKFSEQAQLSSPPGTGSWRHVQQIHTWTTHSSSYPAYQVSYGNGAIGVRQATSTTAWGGWRTLAEIDSSGDITANLTGTADVATKTRVTADSAGNRAVVLTTADGTTRDESLYKDAGASFYFNTSNNTLVAPTFSGALAGNATTATSCTGNAATVTGISRNVGDYGSISANTTRGGYYGLSCNGHLVLMSNGSAHGIYDDVNNEWWMMFAENAGVDLRYNGSVRVATTNAGATVTGALTATGNVTAYSDERLKSDIETLDGSKVYDMRGVSYTKDGEASSGVIAQELQKVAPELVHEGEEYLSVSYGNLVGYLIEAVKDLKAEIEELKGAK